MTEFSFLLNGSKFKASVYLDYAYANLLDLISSFPSYFNFSHFFALFKHYLHLEWSGSSCSPSEKCFLAFALSPEYNSIIPLR